MIPVFLSVLLLTSINAFSQKSGRTKFENLTDPELIEKLASKKERVTGAAVAEILKRGEKLIPLLLKRRNDARFFYGWLAPNPNFTMNVVFPARSAAVNRQYLKEGRLVTIEVAAIYLIEAIFFESLHIANSPYLHDSSAAVSEKNVANTAENITQAWTAVEKWTEKLKTSTIRELRSTNDSPLSESNVNFY